MNNFSEEVVFNICSFMDQATLFSASKSRSQFGRCEATLSKMAQKKREACEKIIPRLVLKRSESLFFNANSHRPWNDFLVNLADLERPVKWLKREHYSFHVTSSLILGWLCYENRLYMLLNESESETKQLKIIDLTSRTVEIIELDFIIEPLIKCALHVIRPDLKEVRRSPVYIFIREDLRNRLYLIVKDGSKVTKSMFETFTCSYRFSVASNSVYFSWGNQLTTVPITRSGISMSNEIILNDKNYEDKNYEGKMYHNGNKLYVVDINKLNIYHNNEYQRDVIFPVLDAIFPGSKRLYFSEVLFHEDYVIVSIINVRKRETEYYYFVDNEDSQFELTQIYLNIREFRFFLMSNHILTTDPEDEKFNFDLIKPEFTISDVILGKQRLIDSEVYGHFEPLLIVDSTLYMLKVHRSNMGAGFKKYTIIELSKSEFK